MINTRGFKALLKVRKDHLDSFADFCKNPIEDEKFNEILFLKSYTNEKEIVFSLAENVFVLRCNLNLNTMLLHFETFQIVNEELSIHFKFQKIHHLDDLDIIFDFGNYRKKRFLKKQKFVISNEDYEATHITNFNTDYIDAICRYIFKREDELTKSIEY